MELTQQHSLRGIYQKGENLYLEKFKSELEHDHLREYAVIDVDSEQYVVQPNKFEAVKIAQQKFGKKIFYIVQIGDIDQPTRNYTQKENASWDF